jgi:hypothetical protein
MTTPTLMKWGMGDFLAILLRKPLQFPFPKEGIVRSYFFIESRVNVFRRSFQSGSPAALYTFRSSGKRDEAASAHCIVDMQTPVQA